MVRQEALIAAAIFAILQSPVSPASAQAYCPEVAREVREAGREVARERREARREFYQSDSRLEARQEVRAGAREVYRQRREARREIRREVIECRLGL